MTLNSADEEPAGVNPQIMTTEGEVSPSRQCEPDGGVGVLAEGKKKKKKSKSKGGKSQAKPTGFEENYADAPLTPAEFQEELSLYDQQKSFHERIQIAIQRFVARRKLDSDRKDVFDKYLAFGGIDCGPKQFSGTTQADLAEMTAEEIADMKATHFVSTWVHDQAEVDFDGMLKAFLSSRLPKHFALDSRESIRLYVHVIRAFLNYLLHHDVCPEYEEQIYNARKTCDVGEAQLWLLHESARALPGDFNKACSVIWGGQYFNSYIDPDNEWAKRIGLKPGMTKEQAHVVFVAALSNHGTEENFQAYVAQNSNKRTKIVRQFEASLEVTDIQFASYDVRQQYKAPAINGLHPTGKLKAQTWHNPATAEDDLTEEEEAALAKAGQRPVETFEFWVEDVVLEKMFVGMKLHVQVYELSFRVYYFDTVTGTLCSFYSFVPNEDMIGWREHKYLPPREDVVGVEHGEGDDGGDGAADGANDGVDDGTDEVEELLAKYDEAEDIIVGV